MPSKKSPRKKAAKPGELYQKYTAVAPVNHLAVGAQLAFIPVSRYREGEDVIVKSTATELELYTGVQPAGLTIQYPTPPFTAAWISNLWIPWKWRKRGLARSLMLHAIERIHARGFDVALAAWPYGDKPPTQAALVRFYTSLGFEPLADMVLLKRRPTA